MFAVLAALAFTVPNLAEAGAGSLGPGDTQLQSGEFYDRVSFEGRAGDRIVIELSSTEFDPYLLILDANDQVLLQVDDSAGAGLNVLLTYDLPAAGRYSLIVTSARPGEAGGYRLSIAAPSAAGSTPASQPAASGQPSAPAPAAPVPVTAAQPRTVTGIALDTNGQPIAGARVWILPSLTTGVVEVRTDSQGRYLAEGLIEVPYRARAWTYVEYGGRQLCLRLGMDSPADYDSFVPTHGAVRNFRMLLTGPIEDLRDLNEHFGGMVRVFDTMAFAGSGNRLEFTFTPTGALIDGSRIQPFVRTLDPRDSDIHGLPIGPYRVTAVLVGGDGSRRQVNLARELFDAPVAAVDIDWTGDGSCSNQSGVDWNYLYLERPQ